MGKYIHKFNAYNDFEEHYWGDRYLEPWVSLTEYEKSEGLPTSVTITDEGSGEDIVLNFKKMSDDGNYLWFDNNSSEYYVITSGSNGTFYTENGETFSGYDDGIYVDWEASPEKMVISLDDYINGKEPVVGGFLYYSIKGIKLDLNNLPSVGDNGSYICIPQDANLEYTKSCTIKKIECNNVMVEQVDYNKRAKEKLYSIPLTFEALNNSTFKISYDVNSYNFEYKLNDGEWTTVTFNDNIFVSPVNAGDKISLRGDNSSFAYDNSGYYNDCNINFVDDGESSQSFNVSGNIMSIVNSQNFAKLRTLETPGIFTSFFADKNVVSAENLYLPATTLTKDCYRSMFSNCTSLTGAPELPATKLAESCYGNMFYYCTSLTTAPTLPATKLANYCYQYMFEGCSSLNYIKCLATDISASESTSFWVSGVASTGTFVKAASMTGWLTGTDGIPSGWSVSS